MVVWESYRNGGIERVKVFQRYSGKLLLKRGSQSNRQRHSLLQFLFWTGAIILILVVMVFL